MGIIISPQWASQQSNSNLFSLLMKQILRIKDEQNKTMPIKPEIGVDQPGIVTQATLFLFVSVEW